jgi:hypothetical protein
MCIPFRSLEPRERPPTPDSDGGPSRAWAISVGVVGSVIALGAAVVSVNAPPTLPGQCGAGIFVQPSVAGLVPSVTVLVLAALTSAVSLTKRPHVLAAIIGTALLIAAVGTLLFAGDLHRGHSSFCDWNF